jgi:hypothetical protein
MNANSSPKLEDRISELRAGSMSAVEEVFRLAFERPASKRFVVASVLMQQVADDLATVEELVARPEPRAELRVLEGGGGMNIDRRA